jgi:hypothetical protein
MRGQWRSRVLCVPGYWFQWPALHPIHVLSNNYSCEMSYFSSRYLRLYRVDTRPVLIHCTFTWFTSRPCRTIGTWWPRKARKTAPESLMCVPLRAMLSFQWTFQPQKLWSILRHSACSKFRKNSMALSLVSKSVDRNLNQSLPLAGNESLIWLFQSRCEVLTASLCRLGRVAV